MKGWGEGERRHNRGRMCSWSTGGD
jgi:hypothetical protein